MLMCAAAVASLLLGGTSPRPATETASERVYRTLLLEAQRNGAGADWRALRQAYFLRPSAAEVEQGFRAPRTAMLEARRTFAWEELLRLSRTIIAADYADGEAHLLAASALGQLGRREEADREQALALAIFRSMLATDGMSAENAIEVFSVNEEYELMYARQRHVSSQAVKQLNGHSYDVLETMGAQGVPMTFWFQIDQVLANEKRYIGS